MIFCLDNWVHFKETVSFPENDPGQSQEVVLKIFPEGVSSRGDVHQSG